MKEGPDIARIATLIGDPARANMLTALMGGQALTATELAGTAGVTLATASAHLSKLEDGGLLTQRKQGRHRYFALADHKVASLLEDLAGLAATRGHLRHRPGPKDPALRRARICYDHLAGDFGVRILDSLIERGAILSEDDTLTLTTTGRQFVCDMGIDLDTIETELMLADMESLEKRVVNLEKRAKGGDKESAQTLKLVKLALEQLSRRAAPSASPARAPAVFLPSFRLKTPTPPDCYRRLPRVGQARSLTA